MNLFEQFGTNLTAPILIAILAIIFSIPIFNLTIEEKSLISMNVRLLRTFFMEIGIFLVVFMVTSSFGSISVLKHKVISAFPFITGLSSLRFLIIFFAISMILLVSFLFLIRFIKKFRVYIFGKIRLIVSSKKRILQGLLIATFIILVYFYVIPPVYFLGLFSDILLIIINDSFNANFQNSSDVLFHLFTNFPSRAYVSYIFCYLAMYLLVRLIFGQLYAAGNLFAYSKVIAHIRLVNGKKLKNKSIIRPSIDGALLLEDEAEPSKKYILPKSSILYIEFEVKHISLDNDPEIEKENT